MKKIAFITVTNEQRKVFDSMTYEQRTLALDIMEKCIIHINKGAKDEKSMR